MNAVVWVLTADSKHGQRLRDNSDNELTYPECFSHGGRIFSAFQYGCITIKTGFQTTLKITGLAI